MKAFTKWVAIPFAVIVLLLFLTTHVFSNMFMLLMDEPNFIPEQSSLFTFRPSLINEGSSSWWIYGEDGNNYYHFSHEAHEPYLYIGKDNTCSNFSATDYRTWCSAQPGARKE